MIRTALSPSAEICAAPLQNCCQSGTAGSFFLKVGFEEFMRSSFQAQDEALHFRSAELSEASRQVLQRKLARLTTDFNELADLDRHVPSREKRSVALMMACRPWVFSMFDGLRKR